MREFLDGNWGIRTAEHLMGGEGHEPPTRSSISVTQICGCHLKNLITIGKLERGEPVPEYNYLDNSSQSWGGTFWHKYILPQAARGWSFARGSVKRENFERSCSEFVHSFHVTGSVDFAFKVRELYADRAYIMDLKTTEHPRKMNHNICRRNFDQMGGYAYLSGVDNVVFFIVNTNEPLRDAFDFLEMWPGEVQKAKNNFVKYMRQWNRCLQGEQPERIKVDCCWCPYTNRCPHFLKLVIKMEDLFYPNKKELIKIWTDDDDQSNEDGEGGITGLENFNAIKNLGLIEWVGKTDQNGHSRYYKMSPSIDWGTFGVWDHWDRITSSEG